MAWMPGPVLSFLQELSASATSASTDNDITSRNNTALFEYLCLERQRAEVEMSLRDMSHEPTARFHNLTAAG